MLWRLPPALYPLIGRWVYLDVYHAILDRSKATGAGLALLLAMARHLNAKGECWASVPTLAVTSNPNTVHLRRNHL
ncbi:MAG TPA: hypothetical protein VE422_48210 [Terriglobia bacterium]|nr:hypothetical protein [Terriglobia bacterium]